MTPKYIYICQGLPVPGVKKFPMYSSMVPTASVSYTDLIQEISYNMSNLKHVQAFFQEVLALASATTTG